MQALLQRGGHVLGGSPRVASRSCSNGASTSGVHPVLPALSHRCALPRVLGSRFCKSSRVLRLHVQPAVIAAASVAADPLAALQQLERWVKEDSKLPVCRLQAKRFKGAVEDRAGFVATADLKQGASLLEVPDSLAVTSVDAQDHALVGPVAAGCSELVALALWLIAERALGPLSTWAPLLQALPETTLSPLLWDDKELEELAGSELQAEARRRQAQLRQQWQQLQESGQLNDAEAFPPSLFNESAFTAAMAVILAHAVYLPSAECFALLPVASLLGRTGNEDGCDLDFDAERGAVVVTAGRSYREGEEVVLNDGRPNGELLLSTGSLQDGSKADYLMFPARLIPGDKLFSMKAQILEQLGFSADYEFPVCADRMPNQLLAYLRLSRIQDPGLFAKVSFETDVIISDMNEYEVLQLLMGDCRERLAQYKTNVEDEAKLLQGRELNAKQRLASRLRLSEKRILYQTMDAVRRRLAPIRGIPTKKGEMSDPNADLTEIFDFIEGIPQAPKKALDTLAAWARGEFDPDWKKPPPRPGDKPTPRRPW